MKNFKMLHHHRKLFSHLPLYFKKQAAEERKVTGAMEALIHKMKNGIDAGRSIHEGILLPTQTYGNKMLVGHLKEGPE